MPSIPVKPTSYALWAKDSAKATGAYFINLNGIIWDHYKGMTL